jgi:hypothetical protein
MKLIAADQLLGRSNLVITAALCNALVDLKRDRND